MKKKMSLQACAISKNKSAHAYKQSCESFLKTASVVQILPFLHICNLIVWMHRLIYSWAGLICLKPYFILMWPICFRKQSSLRTKYSSTPL